MPAPQFTDTWDVNLEIVNEILTAGGLPPVTDLDGAKEHEDAAIAWRQFLSEGRSLQSQGWWFNTRLRYDVLSDEDVYTSELLDGSFIGIGVYMSSLNRPYVLKVRNSPRGPGDPHHRLTPEDGTKQGGHVYHPGMADGSIRVFHKNVDEAPLVDIIDMVDPDDLPQEAREFLINRTARKFHRPLGVVLDTFDEQVAYENLRKADSRYWNSQGFNTLNRSSTFFTWNR